MENQTQIGYAFFKAAAGLTVATNDAPEPPPVTNPLDVSAATRGPTHGGTGAPKGKPAASAASASSAPASTSKRSPAELEASRANVMSGLRGIKGSLPVGVQGLIEKLPQAAGAVANPHAAIGRAAGRAITSAVVPAGNQVASRLKNMQSIADAVNAQNRANEAGQRLYDGALGVGLGGLAGGLLGYGVKKRKGALLGGLLGAGVGGLAGAARVKTAPMVTGADVMKAQADMDLGKQSNNMGPMAPFSNRSQMADMNAGNLGKKLDSGLGRAQPTPRPPQSAGSLFKANLRDAYGLGPAKPAAPVQPEATKSSAQVQAEAWMAREQKLASIIGQLKLSQYDFQGSITGPAAAGPSAAAQSAASKPGLVSRAGKGLVSLAKRHPYGAAAAGVATIAAPALYAYSHQSTSAKPWEGRSPVTAPHVQTYGEEFNGKRPDGMPAPKTNEQNRQGGGAWDWIQNNPGTAAIGASGAAALAYLLSQRQQKEDDDE
jgi:hypothetical protein